MAKQARSIFTARRIICPRRSVGLIRTGYGDPPPQTLIVLGLTRATAGQIFQTCELAGHITNRYNVMNEETTDHPDIFVCRGLRTSWPDFWKQFKYYG